MAELTLPEVQQPGSHDVEDGSYPPVDQQVTPTAAGVESFSALIDAALAAATKAGEAWLADQEFVKALVSVGQKFGPAFTVVGVVMSVVSFLYDIYDSLQKAKLEKALARKMIKEIVERVKIMIDWSDSDIKKFVAETQLKEHVASLKANQDIFQLLGDTSSDEDFDRVRDDLTADVLARTLDDYRQLESAFEDSINADDSALACIVYKYMCDAKQLENLLLQVIDKNPVFASTATVERNIEALIAHDATLEASILKTTRKQFSPVYQFKELSPLFVLAGGFPENPGSMITVFVYFYRGERTEIQNVFPRTLEAANKIKEKRVNQDFMELSKDFRALADEHRKALKALEQTTSGAGAGR